jgi:hypothetical protein
MNNYIIIFYILIVVYILYIENLDIEYFDNEDNAIEDIYTISKKKYEEYITKPDMYDQYIEKYFKKIDYIDLEKITINNDNKIFVSVASYRDPQCLLTVHDLINNATNPENLVIIICQQNDDEDSDCLMDFDYKNAIVKIMRLKNTEAKGPCWARFLIQQEWTGEEYYCQFDSHTRVVKDWDQKCIQELNKLKNINGTDKICLSNYVSTYDVLTNTIDTNNLRGPMFIESVDQDDGFFRFNSNFVDFILQTKSNGWSGCFSFSSSKILHDAPYDPYTPFLFFGEETDIYCRLYTNNWLLHVPTIPICYTVFDRSYRKTFWENHDQEPVSFLSKLRLYYRFGLISDLPKPLIKDIKKFSLGKNKTFDNFLTYCKK